MSFKKLIMWAAVLALIAAALAHRSRLPRGRSRAICCRIPA